MSRSEIILQVRIIDSTVSLLKSVGIELSLPVSGISEVGTSIIVNSGPLGQFSQSCIRGEWGKPCKRCWKCCRKAV